MTVPFLSRVTLCSCFQTIILDIQQEFIVLLAMATYLFSFFLEGEIISKEIQLKETIKFVLNLSHQSKQRHSLQYKCQGKVSLKIALDISMHVAYLYDFISECVVRCPKVGFSNIYRTMKHIMNQNGPIFFFWYKFASWTRLSESGQAFESGPA